MLGRRKKIILIRILARTIDQSSKTTGGISLGRRRVRFGPLNEEDRREKEERKRRRCSPF
jgi:hypothetical protein